MAPPGPIPNPEVKHDSADGSEAIGFVRVGRCQIFPFDSYSFLNYKQTYEKPLLLLLLSSAISVSSAIIMRMATIIDFSSANKSFIIPQESTPSATRFGFIHLLKQSFDAYAIEATNFQFMRRISGTEVLISLFQDLTQMGQPLAILEPSSFRFPTLFSFRKRVL